MGSEIECDRGKSIMFNKKKGKRKNLGFCMKVKSFH